MRPLRDQLCVGLRPSHQHRHRRRDGQVDVQELGVTKIGLELKDKTEEELTEQCTLKTA